MTTNPTPSSPCCNASYTRGQGNTNWCDKCGKPFYDIQDIPKSAEQVKKNEGGEIEMKLEYLIDMEKEATLNGWEIDSTTYPQGMIDVMFQGKYEAKKRLFLAIDVYNRRDIDFIVALRGVFPEIVDYIRSLQSENEKLKKQLEQQIAYS